jgi:polyribonucleotide nucleotidyltransferase
VLAAALQQAHEARLTILDVMAGAISEPRPEVGETAPKIVSFTIPMEKIGEVIGPKGKVINAIQQETGADINVDDDGVVGTVTIGSTDGKKVNEARRQVELIVNPPTAKIGEIYTGRVVNITKFGAFVNILPGRDGLVHISKLGRGKRINRVEDVVDLGDELVVRVEDIDPNGKVSLTPVGDETDGGEGGEYVASSSEGAQPASRGGEVSFEDAFDAEAREVYGDLGPAEVSSTPSSERRTSDRDRNGRDRGGRGGRRR